MTDFNTAKSYQIEGYDKYESVGECIAAWVDSEYGVYPLVPINDRVLRGMGSVTIDAYRIAPRVVLDTERLAESALTSFEEAFSDANLNLTDDVDKLKSFVAYRECKSCVWEALQRFEESLPVTRLEPKPFASRTYTSDEVIAILREVRPRWFREVANG